MAHDSRMPELSMEIPAAAGHLLALAAVFERFTVEDAAEVLAEPVGRLLPVLSQLLATGLVVSRSDVLAPATGPLRDAVLEATPEPVRLALHRRVGTMLLEQGRRTGAAVGHLIAGTRAGDDRSLRALDRAVADLMAVSPAAAADLAVHGLRLTRVHDPVRVRRLVNAIEALLGAGRVDEAEALAQQAQRRSDQPARARIRMGITLSTIELLRGRPGSAVLDSEAVLAEPGLPAPLRDSAETYRLSGLLMLDDTAGAETAAVEILAGGQQRRDAALGTAMMAVAWTTWRAGLAQTAVNLARASVRRGARRRGCDHLPSLGLAAMLGCVGEFAEASRLLKQVETGAGGARGTIWGALPPLLRARHHLMAGRLDEAVRQCRIGLDAADDLASPLFARLGHATLAEAHVIRGDLRQAQEYADGLTGLPTLPMVGSGAVAEAWALARVAAVRDGPAAALELLGEQYEPGTGAPTLLVEEPVAASWMVRMALRAGEPDRARALSACATRLAAGAPRLAPLVAAARHARALIDDDAAGMLAAAGQYRLPLPAAGAFEDAGVSLARHGDRVAARQSLARALSGYRRVGAEVAIGRLRARLRDLGVPSRAGVRAGQGDTGWPSLTDAERRVARVVAEGRTNAETAARLFLSRHTVDFHLRRIFRKLSVSSRTELTRFVLEQEVAPPRPAG